MRRDKETSLCVVPYASAQGVAINRFTIWRLIVERQQPAPERAHLGVCPRAIPIVMILTCTELNLNAPVEEHHGHVHRDVTPTRPLGPVNCKDEHTGVDLRRHDKVLPHATWFGHVPYKPKTVAESVATIGRDGPHIVHLSGKHLDHRHDDRTVEGAVH